MELAAPLVYRLTKAVHDQMGYPNSQFSESVFDLDLLMYDTIYPRIIRPN